MEEIEEERKKEVEALVSERIGLLDAEVDKNPIKLEQAESDDITDNCNNFAGEPDTNALDNPLIPTESDEISMKNSEMQQSFRVGEFYGNDLQETSDINAKSKQEVDTPMDEEEEGGDEVNHDERFRGTENDETEHQSSNREKTSQQDVSQQNGSNDTTETLGRNKRVRQKNRYFLDFHCTDVIKGARSNRDDYESFSTTSSTSIGSTRSSNRRTLIDSKQDGTEVFETKHCRKCSARTPHDADSGCQACLYKKIVENTKRQLSRSASNHSRSRQQNQQQATSNSNKTKQSSHGGHRRRGARQSGSSARNGGSSKSRNLSNTNSGATSPSNTINGDKVNDSIPANSDNLNSNHEQESHYETTIEAPTNGIESEEFKQTIVETKDDVTVDIDANGKIENQDVNFAPKLDTWTPDEVAEYLASRGFADEAESFKAQSVDGISLLLMQRTDFTSGLKIKLGPALKIYEQVCRLKREYFVQNVTSPV